MTELAGDEESLPLCQLKHLGGDCFYELLLAERSFRAEVFLCSSTKSFCWCSSSYELSCEIIVKFYSDM